MTKTFAGLEQAMQRFPAAVIDEYRHASEALRPRMEEVDLFSWAGQGVKIAEQTIRSWEAASEYYRVSPQVLQELTPAQLLEWAGCGATLCQELPSLGLAFFRASASSMSQLQPQNIQGWANLGKGLYRGTWKSVTLAAKFFEISPALLRQISYQELEGFANLVSFLSHKSSELAADCLALGEQVLPQIGHNRLALINLSFAVAETNWREVKGCLESALRVVTHLGDEHRGRFLNVALTMVRGGLSNVSLFLNEVSAELSRVGVSDQGQVLSMAEALLPDSHDAVAAFLHSSPGLLNRISLHQLGTWFEKGRDILRENVDGGLAYFRVESITSEAMLDSLSSSVELERFSGVLRMYCRGLAGSEMDIAVTGDLLAKNIGWVSEGHAATEGTTVYLPASVDRYDTKQDNFSLYKVVATHQVGHIEFGSFDFSFETPAVRFRNLRMSREGEIRGKTDEEYLLQEALLPGGDGALTEAPDIFVIGMQDGGDQNGGGEQGSPTDMGRFFRLFNDRKLSLDLFTVVEDGRLDHRVKLEYPGIAGGYRRIQDDALSERPEMKEMPLQEAMVELLLRLSLQQTKGLPVPSMYVDQARAIALVARRVLSPEATVEDSAEATIRIYDVISSMPNVEVPEDEWTEEDMDEDETSEQDLDSLLDQLQVETGATQPSTDMNEQAYDSPPQVDYRGDFKPELSQLLTNLRMQQGQGEGQMDGQQLSQEVLEQLLADSAELDLDSESSQFDQELSSFVQNFMKEVGKGSPPDAGKGQGLIPDVDDEGYPIETTEPKTFVYDEWDFRAVDYRPRWCLVREKWLPEGDGNYFTDTLQNHAELVSQIRRQFEMMMPEQFRKTKHLPDGEDFDLDAVVESIIDRWAGGSPSEKVHWRRNKIDRDVAVVFLLDMSASTAEAIDESHRVADSWDAPDDPVEYMAWLRTRRGETQRRSYKRIIDVEKESIVLLINALETIGDTYGIYGFSGYGRENVEYYIIKDLDETFSERVKKRIDRITPLHATRMGPAIRHAISKLNKQDAHTKLLFLISDGRPQDRGYSREGVEKEYAVHDTKMALTEARRQNITPFALTVDKAGHDYLRSMCQDMGYEVLDDITALPERLPMLYRKLTV